MSSPTDLSVLKIDESARQRRGAGWLKWIPIVLFLLLIIAGGAYFFVGRAVEVTVMTAQASSTTAGPATLLNASGYVTPRRRATVAAKTTGRVEQIYAEEGMRVQAGQVLAILDQSDFKVQYDSAVADRDNAQAMLQDLQVNLENAQVELHRNEELRKGGVSTQQALDNARTLVQSLKARIAQTQKSIGSYEARIAIARQSLDNCIVRAPFAGIVVSKDAQRGEMVSPVSAGGGFTRTGIATVVDMNSIETEVDVNESYIARVKPGQPVDAVLDAYPDWHIPSHVRTVIPTADRQKATVKVRISFDKLDDRILPDMGVKVSFLEDKKPDNGTPSAPQIVIPKSAVHDDNGSPVVYLFRDGKAERQAVRLGNANGDDQVITAGLTEGSQVIVDPKTGLTDGQSVKIKQ